MQINNPFDEIVQRLEILQISVNKISFQTAKPQETKLPDPDRLVDLPEAAGIIKRPVGTVRYYIHHRSLPATKVGKGFLIKYSELIKWFNDFGQIENNKEEDPLAQMQAIRKRYNKS